MKSVLNAVEKRRTRRGLTLIEAAMVLPILALVVAGVMLFYQNATTSQKISQAAGQISTIQQAVRSMYAGQSTYAGLENANIIQALPRSMLVGTDGLRNAFNGTIVVEPASNGSQSNAAFDITFGGIPSEACVRLATVDLGRSAIGIQINTASMISPPVAPATAQTSCGTGNNSSITWTLL